MVKNCPICGKSMAFYEEYKNWYCVNCDKYLSEIPRESTLEITGKGRLITTKCPNCGEILELPENLDRAFCMRCGGKVIIPKDGTHRKAAIACPECGGRGYFKCEGKREKVFWIPFIDKLFLYSCNGTGKCSGRWEFNFPSCKNGVCTSCKGKGKKFLLKCDYCNGTGKCMICKGSGKCTFCNGTGRIKCEACNGTGFK
jgi:DNA-directed RNA polymerase subunit RPC12/RpoP